MTTTGQDIAGFCVPANHKHFVPLYHSTGKPPKLVSRVSLLSVFTSLHRSLFFERVLPIQNASNRNNPLQYTALRIRKCCTVPPIAARRTAMCLHYKAAINSLLEHKTVKHHKHPEHIWPDLQKGLSPQTHQIIRTLFVLLETGAQTRYQSRATPGDPAHAPPEPPEKSENTTKSKTVTQRNTRQPTKPKKSGGQKEERLNRPYGSTASRQLTGGGPRNGVVRDVVVLGKQRVAL